MNGILKKTAIAVTGFVFLASSASAAPMLPDFVPLAKKAGPAVVNISTEGDGQPCHGYVQLPRYGSFL